MNSTVRLHKTASLFQFEVLKRLFNVVKQTENQETRIDAYSENSSCVGRDVVDDGVGAW